MKKQSLVGIGIVAVLLIAATVAAVWTWTSLSQAEDLLPVSITDDMNPDECSLVHNISACFTGGQAPASVPLKDYWQVFLLARQDLGQRLGPALKSAKLAAVERVEWNDTSLGNPQPGMAYAQVIVPGFKMTIEADSKSYLYHTSEEQVVFLGQNQGPPAARPD